MTTLSLRCLSFPTSFLRSFSHSVSRLCPFPTLQISPRNLSLSSAFGTSFGIYPTSIEFSVHLLIKVKYSILSSFYLLTLALFASILCFSSSIAVFNPFIFTRYFHLIHSICVFFFNPSSPLDFLSRQLTSCISLFISPSILRFHLGL